MRTMVLEVNSFDWTQKFTILEGDKVEDTNLISRTAGTPLGTIATQMAKQYNVDKVEIFCPDHDWEALNQSIKEAEQRLYSENKLIVERIQ